MGKSFMKKEVMKVERRGMKEEKRSEEMLTGHTVTNYEQFKVITTY